MAMRLAGGAASSHLSPESGGGTGRDEHFALMNQGDHLGQQAPVATRRSREDCRGDGRWRGAESAAATAFMASAISRLTFEKNGKFLLALYLRPTSRFFDERSPRRHSICGNIKSCLVNVSRDRKRIVA